MLKIGIVGSHGTGKSTLVYSLAREIRSLHNLTVSVVSEVARDLIAASEDPSFLHRDKTSPAKQYFILLNQLANEHRAERARSDFVITDRTLLDNLVYLKLVHPPESDIFPAFVDLLASEMDSYDLIFYLPIEFPMDVDDVREDDEDFRRLVSDGIRNSLVSLNIPFVTLSGDEETRKRNAWKIIMKMRGMK